MRFNIIIYFCLVQNCKYSTFHLFSPTLSKSVIVHVGICVKTRHGLWLIEFCSPRIRVIYVNFHALEYMFLLVDKLLYSLTHNRGAICQLNWWLGIWFPSTMQLFYVHGRPFTCKQICISLVLTITVKWYRGLIAFSYLIWAWVRLGLQVAGSVLNINIVYLYAIPCNS